MSTTTLPNIRVSSDLTVRVRLKDGGVAIDWSTLNNIKAHIYSDAQRALAGRCDVSVDAEDSTLLVCSYAANKPQYVGVNRIVVSARYMGEMKTYDKPAFSFVRWTADQEGEEITIDDPDVDVEIEVEDVTSSILQEAIDAALQAAADAEHAAHLVPLEVLQDCEQATADAIIATAAANAAGIDEVQATVDAQVGTPSVDVDLENKVLSLDFHNMKGETGEAAGFGTASASLTEDGGDPGVTVSASGPDTAKQFAFTFKNLKGDKGDKGDQGNTGSSVDYPYELVNNLTTNDATKGLTAAMGVTLEGEVSQLETEVNEKADQAELSQLQQEVDEKLDAVAEESPEFLRVYTDADDKILWAIKADGTVMVAAGFEAAGDLSFDGEDVKFIEQPEFAYLRTDADGRILYGVQKDGNFLFGCGIPKQIIEYISNRISDLSLDEYEDIVDFLGNLVEGDNLETLLNLKVDKENGKSLINSEYAATKSYIESPEFIDVETDNNSFVLSSRGIDGSKKEYIGLESPKVIIGGVKTEGIDDLEGRSEIKTDNQGKIISYRDKDGILHELAGIRTASFDYENAEQTIETSVYLERPKFAEFRFFGQLPTDTSESRKATLLDFVYKVNGQVLLSAKCTLAIQGHGSVSFPKKGYTFEPLNKDGESLEIKWGDMIAVDSFHLKAYYVDKTHSHGIGGANVWKKMVEQLTSPYNKVNNIPLDISAGQKIDAYCISDAQYCEDGFPFSFYINDTFLGLYTLKLKKNRKNYGMEKGNKSEIFLDCLGFDVSVGHSAKLDEPFDAGAWDLKNPKLKNYEEGGEITDATVLANIERLFTFTNNITTMYSQHEDYLILPLWLTWFIHCELIGDSDKNGNNLELATWDGTHWAILPYDMDATVGVYEGGIQTSYSGYVLTPSFYQDFRTCFEPEIKALYTKLRRSGCIESGNLYRLYLNQVNSIPRFVYEKDREIWPKSPWNNGEWPVIEQTYTYLQSRIEYLDSVWLLSE